MKGTAGCNPGGPLQESPGPSGPGIPKESPKSLPGPSGPGVQKVSETVSRQSPEFRTLFGPGPNDSFGIPGPEGPGDSCKGQPGLQENPMKIAFRSIFTGGGRVSKPFSSAES